jgi:hypothetical protein
MNRFLLFAGDFYYPKGGWHDLQGNFETAETAEQAVKALNPSWWHIVDSEEGEIVKDHRDE